MSSRPLVLPFDFFSPLATGTTLIEASAGTGKTTAIGRIFVRLIVEEKLEAKKILVVTFTEAATKELRQRIRGLLRQTLDAFTTGNGHDDFFAALVSRNDPAAAIRLVTAALRGFDEVPVYTIHGFCERVLRENAFESGQTFDSRLITDQEALVAEITHDFWRLHFYNASPPFVAWAMENNCDPQGLLSLYHARIVTSPPRLIPRPAFIDTKQLEDLYMKLASSVREEWKKNSVEVIRLLGLPALNARSYNKISVQKLIATLELFFASKTLHLSLVPALEKLTAQTVARAMKKGHQPVSHRFFDLFQELSEAALECAAAWRQNCLSIKAAYLDFMEKELVLRKKEQNILYFDDLLLRVRSALDRKAGKRLTKAVRSTYKAALIDEFQDTDPVQYAIFAALFSRETILFLIGDPKQAIFSFRGADIFAYIKAAAGAKRCFTLTRNYRSDPDLITAVNALFCRQQYPFVYEEIAYRRVDFPQNANTGVLFINGQKEAPFRLWLVDQAEKKNKTGSATKSDVQLCIGRAVAYEISRLVGLGRSGRAFIEKGGKKEPLQPSDIAVLVRTHREALMMQEILSASAIHSVLDSDASVFESPQSRDIELVLLAIADPSRQGRLKTALTTRLFSLTAAEISLIDSDESAADRWVTGFYNYHTLWRDFGFMAMISALLSKENVRQRLLSMPGGERSLTNVLHLAELLHKHETSAQTTMSGLLSWLADKRMNVQNKREDEDQIRLESDDNSVRIVTIHKSKGLEYPVVFCPFAWQSSEQSKKNKNLPFVFHDPQSDNAPTLVMGENEIDSLRHFRDRENLAENLRLLYVSLTRAKVRCYFVWGSLPSSDTSAPAYLFHGRDHGGDAVASLKNLMQTMTFDSIKRDCSAAAKDAGGAILIGDLPAPSDSAALPEEEKPQLSCRDFAGKIVADWKVVSFTSLAHDRPAAAEHQDLFETRQAALPVVEPSPSEGFSDIAHFPRGAKTGIFLHELLETIDFTDTTSDAVSAQTAEKLASFGFDTVWKDTILKMLSGVVSVSLEDNVTLSSIGPDRCLRELEFYFPLQLIGPDDLERFLSCSGINAGSANALSEESPDRLIFSPAKGFMKGVMDLVFEKDGRFFLVDWKSNYLGPSIEDYKSDSLKKVMLSERYVLQYHLYLTALHTYLSTRLPGYDYDKHFGSVYYVFLRGIDPKQGPDFGIFRHRPEKQFVEEMCTRLIDRRA